MYAFLKKIKKSEWISWTALAAILIIAAYNFVYHMAFGEPATFIVFATMSALFVTVSVFVVRVRLPYLWGLICIGSILAFGFSNGILVGWANNWTYAIQSLFAAAAAVAGTIFAVRENDLRPRLRGFVALAIALLIAIGAGATWAGSVAKARASTAPAQNEVFAVPEKYDSKECPRPGRTEEFTYETKAYATDRRAVTKKAIVYLPYNYNETQHYNILYLLHGTGDSYDYWLIRNPKNKTMVDNLIYYGDIQPLIIVTPTWYVENDCADDLDRLTYTFKEEIRNDLLPAVESKYATYAHITSEQAFANSRAHRAFAGLSRGSVTTYHSALIGCLDYFGWFGNFSASRTTEEEFAAIRTGAFADLPIHYLYCTNGSYDFSLYSHYNDMQKLLRAEPRLVEGVNYSFDVFPMQYHSAANWHISLYNCLQKFFVMNG